MLPEHNNPRNPRAHAPYNFVPLPEEIVRVNPGDLPCQDHYDKARHTGRIEVELTTDSLVFVRAALNWEDFAALQQDEADKPFDERAKNKPEFFYLDSTSKLPVIPGSSLRGMLRALVEIASYSKVQWVTDQQRYFFRAVAARSADPLAEPYKSALDEVRAGYAAQEGDKWYVLPACTIGGSSHLSVKETMIPHNVLPKNRRFNSPKYKPGYFDLSFKVRPAKRGGVMVDDVAEPGTDGYHSGVLVCTGSMTETAEEQGGKKKSPRRRHHIVPMPRKLTKENLIPIDSQAVEDYRHGLTDFVRENYDDQNGCLVQGSPIFYLVDPDNVIRAFGHTPNFRVAYRTGDNARASTPLDFVPEKLRREEDTDLAEAIFGYTKSKGEGKKRAYAGRVFFEDAHLIDPEATRESVSERVIVPKILATPKPTTFQHYLVQPSPNNSRNLRHYASVTPDETVIRGHKLYWHKGNTSLEQIEEEADKRPQTKKEKIKDTQHTQMQPVTPSVSFKFSIRFENLSKVELGALLWVLRAGSDEGRRLKLGMGKAYGMGAMRVDRYDALIEKRAARYQTLFEGEDWAGSTEKADRAELINAFETFILENRPAINPQNKQVLAELPRIQALLAMLAWPGPQADTSYMTIKPNEYRDRPVLPGPLGVTGQ